MIPKIIHYCWFGKGQMPELVRQCMASWHRYMPDWKYMEWNENNFDVVSAPLYVRQAYETRRYAFVSDYVRLWALEQYGGVYLDTDVEVIKSFEPLLTNNSFIGFEESKAKTLGTNVIGAEAHTPWIMEMMGYYHKTFFIKSDGTLDVTANSELIARLMETKGLIRDGREQEVDGLHIYDFHYFSPITSTRVMRKNKDTYSIHHCFGSWTSASEGNRICNSVVVREIVNALVQIKRLLVK